MATIALPPLGGAKRAPSTARVTHSYVSDPRPRPTPRELETRPSRPTRDVTRNAPCESGFFVSAFS